MVASATKQILVIEDDLNIPELLGIHFEDLGYQLEHAADGIVGLQQALEKDFDLVILDLMLPGLNGLEVCRELRAEKQSLPILMLTAKSEEMDKVLGLELGADDYISKPFSIRELMARIKAIFRRVHSLQEEAEEGRLADELVFGDLVIKRNNREVLLAGRRTDLTAKEFDLLAFLASSPGRAYDRQELLDYVWGYQFSGYEHTVNSHINRLRAKIEQDPSNPRYILTVWGFGYRFAGVEDLDR
jgi:DNA-binding response OmpR family regulator